jgi:hypothetical protein
MMQMHMSLCHSCEHLARPEYEDAGKDKSCRAYTSIPEGIFMGDEDHRRLRGDEDREQVPWSMLPGYEQEYQMWLAGHVDRALGS